MAKVTIYSTPTCSYCKMAKQYFTENNVEYEEHDVSVDEAKRAEMVEKSGQLGVPVILIGDEVQVGFNKPEIERALSEAKGE